MQVSLNDLPLVAIVTPVFNGAAFLQEAMDSVQAQSYPAIVHIVLDNASTDGTAAILRNLRPGPIPVLIYRNEETLPITDNWDRAFSFVPADAVYVKLHCADDLIHASCIEKFVALSEASPDVQAVSCHDVYHDEIRRANLPDGVQVVDGKLAARMMMDRSICWLPYQHLFVRVDPRDDGAPFFGTHRVGADPHVMVRAVVRGAFGYIDEPLVYTRRHGNNFSDVLATDNKTPVSALQINMMLTTYFDIMLHFGSACWNDREYRAARTFAMANLARTALRWRAHGYDRAREDLTSYLQSVGTRLRYRDYLGAIVGLPGYMLWRRRKNTRTGPGVTIDYFKPDTLAFDEDSASISHGHAVPVTG